MVGYAFQGCAFVAVVTNLLFRITKEALKPS